MHYSITFPADFKNISPLRDLVSCIARLQEFDHQKTERLKSVVDELCSNAIEYGSQPTSEVILEIHANDENIRITCLDQGHGNKLTAGDIRAKLEETVESGAARGRGMRMIVKGFMDELTISDREGGGIKVETVLYK